ncbi:hypothetical protein CLOSTMETH_01701 [[Clostridium] methylpentosum DSM 5476]|uniref:Uncharacterized protein n=1 Tax=[Clostridium] methylpentosum DSM 5476 TaxID=537013 RepID=C0ECY0_9FIRM|nr:hypothetical protein CLOSTMETH_01701 [[Clostridium] methylpentosum DSM 5476]
MLFFLRFFISIHTRKGTATRRGLSIAQTFLTISIHTRKGTVTSRSPGQIQRAFSSIHTRKGPGQL